MTQNSPKHKSLRTPKTYTRPDLGAWSVNEVEAEVVQRVQEIQRATDISHDLRQKISAVVRYGLNGLDGCDKPPKSRCLGDVARACGSPTHRDDVVASLLDAARARLALTYVGRMPVTSRQIAALACRSRPSVQEALGSAVGRCVAEEYLATCPEALAPWGSEGARARRRAERAAVREVASALDAGGTSGPLEEPCDAEDVIEPSEGGAECALGPSEPLRRPIPLARQPEAWPAFPPPPVAAPALPGPLSRGEASPRRVLHVDGRVRVLEMREGVWQEVSL